MDKEALQEQVGKSKKMLYVLGVVTLFAIYMMWPSGADESDAVASDLDAELAALQATRDAAAGNPVARFDGTDKRGVAVGGGGDSGQANSASFETGEPDVVGTLVGYGSQTDSRGEYLVAYISKSLEEPGYEVDLRDILRYELSPPSVWEIDQVVQVYGSTTNSPYKIRARSLR